ncbi:membrane protein [Bacteroidia bacterium]|nr:membrane protein [Bacteroidia bacterium]
MKKNFRAVALATLLSGSLTFGSCIGSFGLSSKLLDWNKSVGDNPWTNELVFFCLAAVQVYTVSMFIDAFILNSLEFWTGENPSMTEKKQTVKTDNGLFTIVTNAEGHKITKEGSDETVEFRFNKAEKSWSLVSGDTNAKLVQFVDNNRAQIYFASGATATVSAGFFAKR